MKKEFEIRKRSTTCEEPARRFLDISRDEYALCSYVQYRQAYPDQKKRGFCCDDKAEIAFFVGISRAGLYKMIDRMAAKLLLEAEPATGFLSVTKHWIETETGCKLSRQSKNKPVNKVDTNCQLSGQHRVNLVTPNIDEQLEYKYEQGKEQKEVAEKNGDGLALENSSLDAKKENKKERTGAAPKRDANDPRPFLEERRQILRTLYRLQTDAKDREQTMNRVGDINMEIEKENNIDRVVAHLNQTLKGAHYTTTKKETRTAIRKRLNEQPLENLLLVIDSKCREWMNTDMRKHLNPETLFNGHFEKYLQAAILERDNPIKAVPQKPRPGATTRYGADEAKYHEKQAF